MPGVFGIEDRIKLITSPERRDIKNDINGTFMRSARLAAHGLSVSTSPGSASLSGVVRSWAEHDEGYRGRLGGSGRRGVYDRIKVEY